MDSTIITNFLRTFHKYYESESIIIQLYNVFKGLRATDAIRILNKIKQELLLELNTEKRVSLASSDSTSNNMIRNKLNSINSQKQTEFKTYGGFPPQGITPEYLKAHPEHSIAFSDNELKLLSLLFFIVMLTFMYEALTKHDIQIRIKRFLAKMNRTRILNTQQVIQRLSQRPANILITFDNYKGTVFKDAVIDIEIPFDENMDLKQDPITFNDINDNDVAVAIYERLHEKDYYYLFEIESFEEFLQSGMRPLKNPSTSKQIELNNVFMCRVNYYRA